MEYRFLIEEDGPSDEVDAIINSIEKRWKNSDQVPFILSVILHPLHKMSPFSTTNPHLALMHVFAMVQRAWNRFFPKLPAEDLTLFNELQDYLLSRGLYASLDGFARMIAANAELKAS